MVQNKTNSVINLYYLAGNMHKSWWCTINQQQAHYLKSVTQSELTITWTGDCAKQVISASFQRYNNNNKILEFYKTINQAETSIMCSWYSLLRHSYI